MEIKTKEQLQTYFNFLQKKNKHFAILLDIPEDVDGMKKGWNRFMFDSYIPDLFPEITMLDEQNQERLISAKDMLYYIQNEKIKVEI